METITEVKKVYIDQVLPIWLNNHRKNKELLQKSKELQSDLKKWKNRKRSAERINNIYDIEQSIFACEIERLKYIGKSVYNIAGEIYNDGGRYFFYDRNEKEYSTSFIDGIEKEWNDTYYKSGKFTE